MTYGFIITKMVQSLLLPPSVLIIIIGLGFILARKRPRPGRGIMLSGLVLFYLLSIGPVADALIRPLESNFPPVRDASLNRSNTIVILTGGVRDLSWLGIRPEPTEVSLSRLIYGIALYRQSAGASIVISGGSGDPQKPDMPEADAMKDTAVSLGVPAGDMVIERGSRNTIESAKALKRTFGRERVVLVTSAYHMKRAVAVFRKAGIDVVPAPADYISEQNGFSFFSFIPTGSHLRTSATALSEYMSFTWYRLRGEF